MSQVNTMTIYTKRVWDCELVRVHLRVTCVTVCYVIKNTHHVIYVPVTRCLKFVKSCEFYAHNRELEMVNL